jgi:hypothetical protein
MALPEYLGPLLPDRDRIVARFRWLHALSPQTAREKSELNVGRSPLWDDLYYRGWIREAAPGRFYLDEGRIPKKFVDQHPHIPALVWLFLTLAIGALIHFFGS